MLCANAFSFWNISSPHGAYFTFMTLQMLLCLFNIKRKTSFISAYNCNTLSSSSKRSPLVSNLLQCLYLSFPRLKVVIFLVVPAAFVTIQVKVDLRSSILTGFNSNLLRRTVPFFRVLLKQSSSSAAAPCSPLFSQTHLNSRDTHSSSSWILPLLGVSSGNWPSTSQ